MGPGVAASVSLVNPSQIDPEREDDVFKVIATAERQVGEDRFGGAWIDRTSPTRPIIGIAVVEPVQPDVEAIHRSAQEAGWSVQIIAVRYSRVHLIGLLESLGKTALPGDAWIGVGVDARFNAVTAQLRRWDDAAVAWIRSRIPADALMIIIHPDVGWTTGFTNDH